MFQNVMSRDKDDRTLVVVFFTIREDLNLKFTGTLSADIKLTALTA